MALSPDASTAAYPLYINIQSGVVGGKRVAEGAEAAGGRERSRASAGHPLERQRLGQPVAADHRLREDRRGAVEEGLGVGEAGAEVGQPEAAGAAVARDRRGLGE